MPANAINTAICDCVARQYGPIVTDTVAYQNSANSVFEAMKNTVAAARNGTLGSAGNGQPIFKSDRDRMMYLHGRQNRASCGVPNSTFAR